MVYSNSDPRAISVMEQARTGNYGEDYYDDTPTQYCPICEACEPEYFYINDDDECVGCSECVHKEYDLI